MSSEMYGLSASDIAVLKRLIHSHNNRTVNTPNRPFVPEGDWHENQQTEGYVIKSPTGGIPSLIYGGSGAVVPGHAVCPVYRISLDLVNNIGDYLIEPTVVADRLVFNLSTSAVAGDQYMLVDRDKFGNWVISRGGSPCPVTPEVRKFIVGVDFYNSQVRYHTRTIDEDGCETWSEAICEDGEVCAVGEVQYYCIGGVCWAYYDGLAPDTSDGGPYSTPSECAAECPIPAVPTCADVPPESLPSTLTVMYTATAGMCDSGCNPGDWSGSAPITKLPMTQTWDIGDWEDPCPGVTQNMRLECVDGQYTFSWGMNTTTWPPPTLCAGDLSGCTAVPVAGTTSPFSLTFLMPACCVCPGGTGGTVTVVITE